MCPLTSERQQLTEGENRHGKVKERPQEKQSYQPGDQRCLDSRNVRKLLYEVNVSMSVEFYYGNIRLK